jgi:Spy/CpxP family protein refolding chaperone
MLLRRVSVLAALMVALGSAVAVAKPNFDFSQTVAQNQPGQGRGERGKDRMMQQLGLNAQQMQDIQAIREKYKPQMQPIMENLRQAKQEMRQLKTNNASADQIAQQQQKMQGLKKQMQDLKTASMSEIRAKLTTEQQAKFDEMKKNRQANGRNYTGKNRGQQSPAAPTQSL